MQNPTSANAGLPLRPLNVWWFSQYASTPDQQFTTQYDLAKKLVERGHRVTFFSSGFSHYKFKELRLGEGEQWRAEDHGGVRFIWIRTPAYRSNDWKRAANMLVYSWKAFRLALQIPDPPDLIIGTTFHPLASLSACVTAVSRRKPFVFEVKDLWPLTAIQFGQLSPRHPVAIALRLLDGFLARRASRIVTTLPGTAEYYADRGVRAEKVAWIPNGLELSRYAAVRPYSGEITGRCTLLYAGGHVSANGLETILRAAEIQQRDPRDVRFVFVGAGQEKPKLVRMAQDLRLANVEFRDPVPKGELYRVMEEADAFILSMRDIPDLYRYGMSFNKLCDYVSCGRPVLFAGNPSHNVVEEFQCGIVVFPERPEAFAAAIQRFLDMTPAERAAMGCNALRCARERFEIGALATRLEEMLLSVVNQARLRQPAARALEDSSDALTQNAPVTRSIQ
ncbi:MAG TPA: glycosyltransferase family 4 protein [Candidatus Aquilonibacter sp.]|nr:glycosyltransferase family 4 protein [Candidatus Aquilonibacter sp.]